MPLTTLARCEVLPNGFSLEQKSEFLRTFARTSNVCEALRLCGIPRGTYLQHLGGDEEFRANVNHVKSTLAWSRTPRLLAIAESNVPGTVAANIWLQKVFGGDEFNPDRAVAPSTVNIAFVQSDLNPTCSGASDGVNTSHIIRHSPSLQVGGQRRRSGPPTPRPCGCKSRGPHQLTCALEGVTKGNVKGSGRLRYRGAITLPPPSPTAPAKNADHASVENGSPAP